MVTVNNKGLKMIAFLLLAFTFAKQQKGFSTMNSTMEVLQSRRNNYQKQPCFGS